MAAIAVVHEDPTAEAVVAHILDITIGIFDFGEKVRQCVAIPCNKLAGAGLREGFDLMDLDQATETVGDCRLRSAGVRTAGVVILTVILNDRQWQVLGGGVGRDAIFIRRGNDLDGSAGGIVGRQRGRKSTVR